MKHSLSLLTLGAAALAAHAQQRPNILLILCDDLGYSDLACYGQRFIATPHLDQLAREGLRFTQAYAGSPVSAPSRASIMTGQHTGRTHVRGNREYWREHVVDSLYGRNADVAEGWAGQEPYAADLPILPEIFKAYGYTTGLFGKWAGGYEGSSSTPDQRGIDEFLGYICQFQAHAYYPNFLNAYHRGDRAPHRVVLDENIAFGMPGEGDYAQRPQYAADIIHRAALDWIDRQRSDQPFLGIFTYTLPHAELHQPEDSLVQHYRGRLRPEKVYKGSVASRYAPTSEAHTQFAAMVSRLDQMVGEIVARLRAKGLDQNTLIVFTSDNGPHEEGGGDPAFFHPDGPLRGVKRSMYEGGIRIPFIVRWPSRVPAGKTSDVPLAFYDLLPTFCDAASIRDYHRLYSSTPPLDGLSFLPTFLGEETKQPRHTYLYWEFHETDMIAVRRGHWKIVVHRGRCALYDLDHDLGERNDCSALHPEVVQQLIDVIYREHRDHPLFPVTLPPRIFAPPAP